MYGENFEESGGDLFIYKFDLEAPGVIAFAGKLAAVLREELEHVTATSGLGHIERAHVNHIILRT